KEYTKKLIGFSAKSYCLCLSRDSNEMRTHMFKLVSFSQTNFERRFVDASSSLKTPYWLNVAVGYPERGSKDSVISTVETNLAASEKNFINASILREKVKKLIIVVFSTSLRTEEARTTSRMPDTENRFVYAYPVSTSSSITRPPMTA
ncbi:hypothetical protein PENTCL1PPCAC_4543, partial [Pristionchus entomophagus]